MDTRIAVRSMTADDVAGAAATLARAFGDDPVGIWCAPQPTRRTKLLHQLFEIQARDISGPHGACLVSDDLAGAALWKPPGTWKVSPLLIVRMLPRFGRIFGRRLPLVLRALNDLEKVHPREPHYYLPFIGVAPERQGRGVGSALLAPVLERCDAEGVGAYLEATCEANLRLYARHGFEVRAEVRLPNGPPVWPMWRDPR
jgi:GNAT superfamily N-acetyltransferase